VRYRVKPMNCPMHALIYKSQQRSYRDLPLRLSEVANVYRNEKSGTLHGLLRVRGLSMDDAHIFCTMDQVEDEIFLCLDQVDRLVRQTFGFELDFEVSTRPEERLGGDEVWDRAEAMLKQALERKGIPYRIDEGGGAFYGPKIDIKFKDAIGRIWQGPTIQLDFNLPERFELEFQAADGTRQRPVMIHRALFGSVERFMGVLTEHYAGAFPAWLAPVQVVGIPVAEAFNDYMFDVVDKLKAAGIRAEVDISSDRFPKKIRTASKDKIPFVLIAGGEDAEAGAVSFRFRDGSQDNGVPVAEAVQRIVDAVRNRTS
jgi:threonyl-tRNA synthetase